MSNLAMGTCPTLLDDSFSPSCVVWKPTMSSAYLNKPENDANRFPNPLIIAAIPCIAEKKGVKIRSALPLGM